jgi:hypothetical protein
MRQISILGTEEPFLLNSSINLNKYFYSSVKTQRMEVTETDRSAIRSVIERQLQAFQNDDAIGAFAFASPGIQMQFVSPENFMHMVKTAYLAVYRPRSVLFEDLALMGGVLTQPVLLLDPEGTLMRALYLMEKQPDATWRIDGCYLVAGERETT